MATSNAGHPSDVVDFVENENPADGCASSSTVMREVANLLRREVAIGLVAVAEGRFSTRSASDIADELATE
ncbi:hypothetical protein [Azospirillum sp. TSO35-2]|uniref:hypothetical protein n=1 Tax=Azospirillum sp. TSO35-2 TaxID=716796 RepID=UPI0011B6914C|nr:hypothetical protein [Azospirillum sp. TSO35-2]